MRKIIAIFITFFAIELPTSMGKCPGEVKYCQPFFPDPYNMEPNITLRLGENYIFLCNADGNPTPSFSWMKNGVYLNISNASLVKNNLQLRDSGNYSCHVCNELGCIDFTSHLTVNARPRKPLTFQKLLKNDTAQIGKPYTFLCLSDKPSDEAEVFWYPGTKEQIIPNCSTNTPDYLLEIEKKRTLTYEISSVSKEDEGWYACKYVSVRDGCIWSDAYLTVESVNDDFGGMFLTTASLLTAMMVVCGLLLYHHEYRKSKLKTLEMTMNNYMRKIVIHEKPNSEEKFEICIEKHFISQQNDDNEKGNSYEMVNYNIPSDKIWDIPRERVQLADKIGEGAFGTVYRATAELKPNTTTTVAVKMLKDNLSDDESLIDLVSEMQMMKMIGKHKNIISLLGRCVDGALWVLMEYAALGNLQNFLRNRRYSVVSHSDYYTNMANAPDEPTLLGFARQISEAMNFMASKKVIHRDLSARNVLVTEEHVMKVADFGLTRYTRDKNYYYTEDAFGRFPYKWMAPESLYHQRYTTKSDVWSFGILLWEIMTMGAVPYGTMSNLEVHDQIKKGLRMSKPEKCSINTYRLMLSCWSYEAQERPNFSEILDELDKIIADFDEERSTSTAFPNNSIRYDSSISSSDCEDDIIVESSLYDVPLIADAPVIVVRCQSNDIHQE